MLFQLILLACIAVIFGCSTPPDTGPENLIIGPYKFVVPEYNIEPNSWSGYPYFPTKKEPGPPKESNSAVLQSAAAMHPCPTPQGAQLPPVMYPPTQGLKYYPDQPVISDLETATGLTGTRVDSVAVVPTQTGSWRIPEMRIPWWDTRTNELRYAVVPERELEVAAGGPLAMAPLANPAPSAAAVLSTDSAAPIPLVANDNSRLWQIVAAANAAGWLLTLLYLIWTRSKKTRTEKPSSEDPREHAAFKSLLQACADGKALQARGAIINWTAALVSRPGLASTAQVTSTFEDPVLIAAISALNAALYSTQQSSWDGSELAEAARRLRSQHRSPPRTQGQPLQLYPVSV